MPLGPGAMLAAALAAAFPDQPPQDLGLAVSGGGDSVALAVLMAEWAADRGCRLRAVTVDHGLRTESAAEAAGVVSLCAGLGIPHDILRWQGWDGRGNLQDQARRARSALIAGWAGAMPVATGHTMDDQAETVLLRLARGSGVDGLSAMRGATRRGGVLWLRPLLGVRRAALRDLLRARGIGWVEDPSNEDPRYDRIKARQALALLAPMGVTAEGLAATAGRMQAARAALERQALKVARAAMRVEAGDVIADLALLDIAGAEIRDRLLAAALCWVGSAEYRPRHAALLGVMDKLSRGRGATLAGCILTVRGGSLRIGREPAAVRGIVTLVAEVWDSRWRISGPESGGLQQGLRIAMLGEGGIALRPRWRESGLPRPTIIASPAVWQGETLVAAPLAETTGGWRAELEDGAEGFFSTILSH